MFLLAMTILFVSLVAFLIFTRDNLNSDDSKRKNKR